MLNFLGKKWLRVVFFVVVVSAFSFFVYSNMQYIKETLRVGPLILTLLFVMSFVNRFVNGLKIRLFMSFYDVKLSFWEWFGSAAVMNFYNYFISKSGTAAVALYLKKKHEIEYSKTLSLFMGDILVAFFCAGIVGMICSLYGYFIGTLDGLLMPASFFSITIAAVLVLVMPEIRINSDKWFLSKLDKVFHGWNILRKDLKMVVKLFVLNLLVMIVFALRYYIVFKMFSSEIPFFVCLIISPLSVIVQFVSFIPGAYGLREALAGFVTKLSDLGFVAGAMATIADRVIMMFTAFILGTISSYKLFNRINPLDQEGGVCEKK